MFQTKVQNWNNLVTRIIYDHVKQSMFLTQMILKTTIQKLQMLYSLILLYMTLVCHSYVLVCHPYVLACHPQIICMYSYDIRMSLVCHPHVLICHPYVLVCHPYVLVCGFTMNRVKMFLKKFSSQGPKFQANIRNPSGDCVQNVGQLYTLNLRTKGYGHCIQHGHGTKHKKMYFQEFTVATVSHLVHRRLCYIKRQILLQYKMRQLFYGKL